MPHLTFFHVATALALTFSSLPPWHESLNPNTRYSPPAPGSFIFCQRFLKVLLSLLSVLSEFTLRHLFSKASCHSLNLSCSLAGESSTTVKSSANSTSHSTPCLTNTMTMTVTIRKQTSMNWDMISWCPPSTAGISNATVFSCPVSTSDCCHSSIIYWLTDN